MLARKDNKEYNVNELSKSEYLAKGYDICDDKGKLIEPAKTSTVPYAEHEKALARIEELEAELREVQNEEEKPEKKSK